MLSGVYRAMTEHVSTEQRFQEMERKVAAEMEEINKVSQLERQPKRRGSGCGGLGELMDFVLRD
jgi:hypothetical protein